MKYVLLIVALMTLASGISERDRGKWIIGSDSQLLIHGQTNVNSFTCFISCYTNVDTLDYTIKNDKRIFMENKMIVPVYNFNCGSNMITRDFRKTVRGDKYPYLYVAFISLEEDKSNSSTHGKLDITLAGVRKRVDVLFSMEAKGDFLQLTGKHMVSFSDFELQAPARMMGLVKVQENLNVEFNLMIKPL